MSAPLTPRQRAKLQQRAVQRALRKWFVPADIAPYASLASVQPSQGARRPFHYC